MRLGPFDYLRLTGILGESSYMQQGKLYKSEVDRITWKLPLPLIFVHICVHTQVWYINAHICMCVNACVYVCIKVKTPYVHGNDRRQLQKTVGFFLLGWGRFILLSTSMLHIPSCPALLSEWPISLRSIGSTGNPYLSLTFL